MTPRHTFGPHDHAVIIAVENYVRTAAGQLPSVDYARADAEAFADLLRGHDVPNDQITLLVDEDASQTRINDDVRYAIRLLGPEHRLVFYYAGHGFHDGTQNLLTTHDCSASDPAASAFGLNDLVFSAFDKSGSESALIFIDACARRVRDLSDSRTAVGNLNRSDLDRFASAAGYRVAFTSCSAGQASYPHSVLRHGVWTYHLLQALSTDVAEDTDVPGVVTSESLQRYLAREVPRYVSRVLGGKVQQPYMTHSAVGPVPLVDIATPEPRPAEERDLIPADGPVTFVHEMTVDVTSLDGFEKHYTVPRSVDRRTQEFVSSIYEPQAEGEIRSVLNPLRKAIGFRTTEADCWGGNLTAPGVAFLVTARQHEDEARKVIVRRELTLDSPTPDVLDALDGLFAERLDSVRVALIEPQTPDIYTDLVDALEDVEAEGGTLDPDPSTESAVFETRGGRTVSLRLGDQASPDFELLLRARIRSRRRLADVLDDARRALDELGPETTAQIAAIAA